MFNWLTAADPKLLSIQSHDDHCLILVPLLLLHSQLDQNTTTNDALPSKIIFVLILYTHQTSDTYSMYSY